MSQLKLNFSEKTFVCISGVNSDDGDTDGLRKVGLHWSDRPLCLSPLMGKETIKTEGGKRLLDALNFFGVSRHNSFIQQRRIQA
jgi:hypothetical protein